MGRKLMEIGNGGCKDDKDQRPKKGLIIKTWERCRSMSSNGRRSTSSPSLAQVAPKTTSKSKSWPRTPTTPQGCFSVYVGPGRERFVVRTERANHPLFRALLEEAEMEYGYAREGPLELPCDVVVFERVLWEMEQDDADERVPATAGCGFASPYHSRYQLLSPSRPALTLRFIK